MQFLEERTVHLFLLGTTEWLSSPRVGDAVFFAHDPDSHGIVLGQPEAHLVYVAWTRPPTDLARQVRKVADEAQEQLDADICRDLEGFNLTYARTE